MEGIEAELRSSIRERAAERGIDVAGVDCPDDAALSQGAAFDCDVPAVGRGVVYTARVTIGDGSSVRWELTRRRPDRGAGTP